MLSHKFGRILTDLVGGNSTGPWHRYLVGTLTIVPSQNASSGQKGNTRNTYRSNKRRYRGVKVYEGDKVHPGFILAKQVHHFRWHAGANVARGRRRTLTALCSGTIRFTKEIFIPGPGTAEAEQVATFPRGAFMYKTFVNIVPEREVARFTLKETV